METRRIILLAALSFIVISLWHAWEHDYPTLPTQQLTEAANQPSQNLLPALPDTQGATVPLAATSAVEASPLPSQSFPNRIIHVKTDVLALDIDLSRGDIVQAALLKYPVSVEEKNQPFVLLYDKPGEQYIAKSSLLEKEAAGLKDIVFNYESNGNNYELSGQELQVTLTGQTADGLTVRKVFHFTKGSYLIQVHYDIVNNSPNLWKGYLNTQLLRSSPKEDKSSLFHIGTYTGASYSNPPNNRYKKLSFSDISKNNFTQDANGGWIAMQQHYFLSAWVPPAQSQNTLYTRHANNDYVIGSVSQAIQLQPQQSQKVSSRLYLGPETASTLKEIAPGLDLTVDYGWLWFLSSLLFSLMKAIYQLVGNWGWAIVLVTVLIKLAFYRLSAKSYRSMAGMRKLQPKLQALRDRYGDDKAKLSQATMELYRQEKINPLGGCLPILVQIPVFIALYWVLLESVELRQAPFIFWIKDLAAADPYHILPVIMGITMFIQQRLNPAPPDPMQAKIMMFLPVLFTGLFWNFPAGLVLYWIINNTLSILQQWYITKKYGDEAQPAAPVIVKK